MLSFLGPTWQQLWLESDSNFTEDTWIRDFCSWNCLEVSHHYLKSFYMLLVDHRIKKSSVDFKWTSVGVAKRLAGIQEIETE